MRWRNGLVVGFAVLAACGGVSKASPSEAMCHEFENGVTPINLVGDRDPNEFAHLVYSSITQRVPADARRPGHLGLPRDLEYHPSHALRDTCADCAESRPPAV